VFHISIRGAWSFVLGD